MKKSKNAKHTKLIYLISNFKNHTVIITIIAFFLFGEIVYMLTHTNISCFHIKHFTMYCICSLAVFTSLKFARKLKSIEIDVATEPVMSVPINRLVKLCYSPIAIIIGVIAGSSYLVIFIMLQFVPINIAGVYSLILTAVDISLAAILLIQYMILVTFIFIISKKDIKKHWSAPAFWSKNNVSKFLNIS